MGERIWKDPRRLMSLAALALFALGVTAGARKTLRSRSGNRALHEGTQLLNDGKYPEARNALAKAIQFSSDPAKAYLLRAQSYIQIAESKRAVADLTKAIELDPAGVVAYQLRANAYLGLSNPLLAAQDLETALRLAPQWVPGYLLRGRAYREIGKLQDSIDDLDMAVALDPSEESYYQRGLTRQALGEYQRAIQDYTIAIELKPGSDVLYRSRAQARTELGDSRGAAADSRRALPLQAPGAVP
jgi:tetratricopeptide (TPR) repeat protein